MTMIERVARAILKSRFYDCEPDAYSNSEDNFWKDIDPDHVEDAYLEARAAIEAMREPTGVMRNRGSWHRHCERMTWQAMIDAALAEEV